MNNMENINEMVVLHYFTADDLLPLALSVHCALVSGDRNTL